jgi:TP901 family phage tail tape measure protein
MSDLEKTIAIIFSGVDEVSDTTKKIGSSLDELGGNISAIADPLSNVGKGVLALEASFATLAGGAIALAVSESGKFNDSMAEVNTLLNLGSSDLSSYSGDVLSYAQTSTQSIDQITQSLYNAASLGVGYADSLDVVGAAEKLAVGAKADLNDALETLIGTMNAYGAPMSQISQYSDAFFTIIKDGKTTLPELSTSIADVTGIASASGISFDVLGASIAAMTASGAPTSQAITKIKAAIEALLAPSSSASKAAAELGIDLSEAALKSKGFPAVLQEIYDKTNGSAAKMGEMIPSVEGLQAALVLGADKSGIFAKSLEDMANKTGATETAFKEMSDNSNLIWQNMANNWDVMLVKFGSSLEDNSKGLIGAFAELWKSIADSIDSGAFDPILNVINELTEGADEQIRNLAKNLPEALKGVDFSEFIKAILGLRDTVFELFNIDLSDASTLEATLQNLVNALTGLTETSNSILKAFDPVLELVSGLITWFGNLDEETQQLIGTILGISVLVAPIAAVGGAVAGMVTAFVGIVGITGGVTGLGVALGTVAGPAIIAGLAAVAASIGTNLFNAVVNTKAATDALYDSVSAYAKATGNEHLLQNIANLSPEAAKAAGSFNTLSHYIQDFPEEVKTKVLATFNDKGVDAAITEVGTYRHSLLDMPEEIKTQVTAAINEGDFEKAQALMDSIPKEKKTEVSADVDTNSISDAKKAVDGAAPDKKTTDVKTEADQSSIEKTKKSVEDAAPPKKETVINVGSTGIPAVKQAIEEVSESKMMEIQLKGDIETEIARINATMSEMNTTIEWTAKMNIAGLEADAKVAVAAFDSVGAAVTATASASADMFSALMGNWAEIADSGYTDVVLGLIREQMSMESDALETQASLVRAQIEYLRAKADALANGDGMIKVSSDGLEPYIEAFMFKILEKIQIRVNEEGLDVLLGAGV